MRLVRAAAVVLALGVLLAAWGFVVEPRWIELTEHRVGAGAPAVTVMHLSDLHVTGAGGNERRVLALVDEVRPDLVVLTGDTVTDGRFDPAPVHDFLAALVAKRPPLGVYACPGNHEDWAGPGALAAHRAAGVVVLEDQVVTLLDGRLALHGLARWHGAAPAGAPTPAFDLVLCHYPAALPRVARPGLELVLAGHSHGGQVRLPFVGALIVPFETGPYDAGWFEHGATRLFVSRGVGTSILPVRFNCRPEVAVHRLDLAPQAGDAAPASR
jgi:predicted MPP superfamily phosphohydrolase